MDSIERTIQVSWRHRVLFTDHVFEPANGSLKEALISDDGQNPRKVLVVLDNSLASRQPNLTSAIARYFDAHRKSLALVCPPMLQQGGEHAKDSWSRVEGILVAINEHHIDRHSYLVAVGGGGFLDLAGLAAATAHRGVRHVRLPSTTLSQCDSGVGVKNGINAFGKKNFVGTFSPPHAVINDFQLLASLADRDKRAGYVEAVKVACIRDRDFFEALEKDAKRLREFELDAMRRLIRRCAELHIAHIVGNGDPFEYGSARPLDFGHWAAHKLEQLSGFNLRHGEAVAIGIALDVVYSRRMGFLDAASAERILKLLETLGFELFAPDLLRTGPNDELVVLEGLEEFREHLGGQLAVTLLREIGTGFEVHEMNSAQVIESIKELEARHSTRTGKVAPATT